MALLADYPNQVSTYDILTVVNVFYVDASLDRIREKPSYNIMHTSSTFQFGDLSTKQTDYNKHKEKHIGNQSNKRGK